MTPVSRRFFVWASILALFLDQVVKIIAHAMYRCDTLGNGRTVRVLGDVLKLSYEQNSQGVFGLRYGPQFIYFILPLAGAALVTWYGLRSYSRWSSTAYGVILAGALGNVIDRARLGYVIDFIVFEVRRLNFRWYTFNVADACIVVGVIMILAREFLWRRPVPGAAPEPGPETENPGTKPGNLTQ